MSAEGAKEREAPHKRGYHRNPNDWFPYLEIKRHLLRVVTLA